MRSSTTTVLTVLTISLACIYSHTAMAETSQRNVLGGELEACCMDPKTGFQRDGYCRVPSSDSANHSVCAIVTDEFLEFSKSRGNDLITPRPGFPGLKEGDGWCLCASRWKEALDEGITMKIKLAATSDAALKVVTLKELKQHASDNREL